MTKTKNAEAYPDANEASGEQVINFGKLLSKSTPFTHGKFWLVGMTPLICHAWSFKAREEMLQKQVGAVKRGKEKRDPQADFVDSLYEIGVDKKTGRKCYGFPAMGIKNAVLSVSHKDKGVPRSTVMQSLWIDAPIVRTRPALAQAICDMPLLRIHGSDPEMREDMVKIGAGLNKVASLAYRGQFRHWAMPIKVRFNAVTLPVDSLIFLLQEAGLSTGIGEWRNERKGTFGAFRIAFPDEAEAWEAYADGNGPLPVTTNLDEAA
jgi:hypothetical protein